MTLIFQNKLFPSICLCFVIYTMKYICLYFFSNHYYACISLSFKTYCTILILYRKLTKIYEWPSYAFEAFQSQYRVVHNLSITNFFLTFFPNIKLPFFQNSDVASGQGRGGARFLPCFCIFGICLPPGCK